MSSQAGPSSTARHKSKQKVAPAPEPSRPFLSKETVDSDLDTEEHDDMDGSESESEDNDSPESEGDLEGVRPRHKADGATAVTQPSASKGRRLP